MPALDRRTLLLAGLTLPGTALARQEPDLPSGPSLFRQVIGQPTGRNGYEELVAAADALRASGLFKHAEAKLGSPQGCPLALKRRVLRDPPVAWALELLRCGLAKPVFHPKGEQTWDSNYFEFEDIRRISRALLPLRQDVLFADGNSREALAMTRLGLGLGFAVQFDGLIPILVSMAICTWTAPATGAHLGQLAAADCEELFRLALEWLRRPDPLLRAIAASRRLDLGVLTELQTANRARLEKMFFVDPATAGTINGQPLDVQATNEGTRKMIAAMESVRDGPGGGAAFETARRWIDDHYDRLAAECRNPPWARTRVDLIPDNSPSGRILALVGPVSMGSNDQFVRHLAMSRLLACHAAIRRYRWEHDRPPPDLDALNLGDITVDPFTGRSLEYEPDGERYRLASAGPENPPAMNAGGGRVAVTLVPGE